MDNLNKTSYGFLKTTGGISVPGIITNGTLEILGALILESGTSRASCGLLKSTGGYSVPGMITMGELGALGAGDPEEEFSLVSHWPLDDRSYVQATHQFTDIGEGGNHGTGNGTNLGGTFDFVNDHHGIGCGATPFDGSSDYIIANDATLNLSNTFSVTAWIKAPSQAYGMIVGWGEDVAGKRRSLFLWNGGSGNSNLYFSGHGAAANIDSGVRIDDNIWHHCAITVSDLDYVRTYVDNIACNHGSTTLVAYNYNGTVIGRGSNGVEYLDGSIADVRVYDHVLSQDEITILFLEKALGFMERFEVLKSIRNIVQITKGRSLKV